MLLLQQLVNVYKDLYTKKNILTIFNKITKDLLIPFG